MPKHVDLYLGTYDDLSDSGKELFERAKLIEAKPTTAPANIKEHYNVEVTVESKETGDKHKTEIDSRTINNWFTRFEKIIENELRSEKGLDGEYTKAKERNTTIVRTLSKLVPIWINTESTRKIK